MKLLLYVIWSRCFKSYYADNYLNVSFSGSNTSAEEEGSGFSVIDYSVILWFLFFLLVLSIGCII